MNHLLIAASHRPDSLNLKLIHLVNHALQAQKMETRILPYGELDLPTYNDYTFSQAHLPTPLAKLNALLETTDSLIISTPEYNWSYPGSLKTVIDWLSRIHPNRLAGKPAFLLSASPSARGGILGLTHLKMSLESLDMFVFPRMFTLGDAVKAFDQQGNLVDAGRKKKLDALLESYLTRLAPHNKK